MKIVYSLICLGFFLYVPVALTYRLHEDFSHPQQWGENIHTDPRVYLPVLALTAVFIVVGVRRVMRESRRQDNIRRRLEDAVHSLIEDRRREDK
jgi:hypothetical protein